MGILMRNWPVNIRYWELHDRNEQKIENTGCVYKNRKSVSIILSEKYVAVSLRTTKKNNMSTPENLSVLNIIMKSEAWTHCPLLTMMNVKICKYHPRTSHSDHKQRDLIFPVSHNVYLGLYRHSFPTTFNGNCDFLTRVLTKAAHTIWGIRSLNQGQIPGFPLYTLNSKINYLAVVMYRQRGTYVTC